MNRLKEARKAAGLTQIEVAKDIGLSQGQYSAWENGHAKIDGQSMSKLAALFGVSVDFLLGNERIQISSSSVIRIPVLGSVPAGIPLEAVEDVIDWEEIPKAMCNGGKEFFALRVQGDSMWPDYLPGDTVIVQRMPVCDSGDDCIVYVNGYDATLKQVKLDADGSVTIVPRNPNYAPRTYTSKEVIDLPVSIAGVVVELRRKVKKGRGVL